MPQTNSDVLRGFIEEVGNQQRIDLLPKYVSEEYVGHGTPYVGLGFAPDYSSGVRSRSTWCSQAARPLAN